MKFLRFSCDFHSRFRLRHGCGDYIVLFWWQFHFALITQQVFNNCLFHLVLVMQERVACVHRCNNAPCHLYLFSSDKRNKLYCICFVPIKETKLFDCYCLDAQEKIKQHERLGELSTGAPCRIQWRTFEQKICPSIRSLLDVLLCTQVVLMPFSLLWCLIRELTSFMTQSHRHSFLSFVMWMWS